jgi:hypothetical protein
MSGYLFWALTANFGSSELSSAHNAHLPNRMGIDLVPSSFRLYPHWHRVDGGVFFPPQSNISFDTAHIVVVF